MMNTLKSSLPWVVPSAAVVFAAYVVVGEFDLVRTDDTVAHQDPLHAEMAQNLALLSQGAMPQALAEPQDFVARQNVFEEPLQQAELPVQSEPLVVAEPEPLPTPRPDPVAVAAPQPVFTPQAFPASAKEQCLRDLRKLSDSARVYFPSGGVTAEQSGIEQGNIIALVAESCPGVQIRVQGHSDASGDPDANLRLSRQRAEEVIRRIAASGADTSMFIAEGIGSRDPSGLRGPQPAAYYDRRVEFVVVEEDQRTASRAPLRANPWADASCVKQLTNMARNTALFYAPRAVALSPSDLGIAMSLAEQAVACPHARLRVVGHHSGDLSAGETVATGRLRAKALMSLLVGRGVPAEQIIIASPSRPLGVAEQAGLPGGRVDFDVILEDG